MGATWGLRRELRASGRVHDDMPPSVRSIFTAALASGLLVGCAAHPRDTIASLDTTTRRYSSPACLEARREAAAYSDRALLQTGVGVAGNLIVPFAGTAAALAMQAERSRVRERLNQQVAAACVPDPLNNPADRPRQRTRRGARR